MTKWEERQARGKGLLVTFYKSFPPASERKLGWMTPRAGVKTTPAIERGFWGPDPKARAPLF